MCKSTYNCCFAEQLKVTREIQFHFQRSDRQLHAISNQSVKTQIDPSKCPASIIYEYLQNFHLYMHCLETVPIYFK